MNVEGTLTLLEFAQKEAESHGRAVRFLYPSSIAAYGLPDLETKAGAGRVKEDEYNHPTTMYGANKLYCEMLGRYYARHYKQLAAEPLSGKVDFRAVRFPGLISADDGAVGRHIRLCARNDSRRGARRALRLLRPPRHADSVHGDARRRGGADSPGRRAARPIDANGLQCRGLQSDGRRDRSAVLAAFPAARISYETDAKRQGIVDSWPAAVDDSLARQDWGFQPAIGFRPRVARLPDTHHPEALRMTVANLPRS